LINSRRLEASSVGSLFSSFSMAIYSGSGWPLVSGANRRVQLRAFAHEEEIHGGTCGIDDEEDREGGASADELCHIGKCVHSEKHPDVEEDQVDARPRDREGVVFCWRTIKKASSSFKGGAPGVSAASRNDWPIVTSPAFSPMIPRCLKGSIRFAEW
jgi:hypothetical protein